MIKAVIFDMDGVLLDTEKHFCYAWKKAANELGYPEFTREHSLLLRSLAAKFAKPKLEEIFGPEFPYQKVRERRRVIMEEVLQKSGVEPMDGVEEAITGLREKGLKIGIATAGDPQRAQDYLTRAGLWHLFEPDNIISATTLENGKPYPDIYLYACQVLEVEPEEAIAVEDSPNGIWAAYRAGTKVVMVPDQDDADEEIAPLLYRKIGSLRELTGILTEAETEG